MKRFSLRKTLISSAMSAALVAGVSLSGTASAVHLAENGIGQVLLAPIYLGLGGNSYTTEVAIVNTRNDVAVKAKVVLRSAVASTEVIDFICYLTPADVCRFKIINKDGQAYLYSNDDSVRSRNSSGKLSFASVDELTTQIFDQRLGVGDNNEIGHIEVIGAYGVQAGEINTSQGKVVVKQGMSKVDLAKIFDSLRPDVADTNGNRYENSEVAQTPTRAASGKIRSADPSWVQLTGEVKMFGANDRLGYQIPALAGKLGDNVPNPVLYKAETDRGNKYNPTLPVIDATGKPLENGDRFFTAPPLSNGVFGSVQDYHYVIPFDGRVISNPTYDVVIGTRDGEIVESALGFEFGGGGSGYYYNIGSLTNKLSKTLGYQPAVVYDNILELEAALARSHVQGTYEDDSQTQPTAGVNRTKFIITFPTKYRHLQKDSICYTNAYPYDKINKDSTYNWYSPPFSEVGNVGYSLTQYDNQENNMVVESSFLSGADKKTELQKLGAEVNYFLPKWEKTMAGGLNFESGWFSLYLAEDKGKTTGCPYVGLPALTFSHKYLELTPGVISNSTLSLHAHKPQLVERVPSAGAETVETNSLKVVTKAPAKTTAIAVGTTEKKEF